MGEGKQLCSVCVGGEFRLRQNAEAALPFTVFMAVFATMMVPAGKFQDIFGPRKVSVIGAILFLGPTDRLH
jgi:MFS family permease